MSDSAYDIFLDKCIDDYYSDEEDLEEDQDLVEDWDFVIDQFIEDQIERESFDE